MSQLFIANAKSQVEAFTYRVPDADARPGQSRNAARVQMIQPGAQIQITGDLNTPQIQAIIDQHAKYGMVSADEVDRNRNFAGLIYSIDKPVPSSRIQSALNRNIDVLKERGRERRQLAAVSAATQLEGQIEEQGLNTDGGLATMEVEVIEQRTSRSDTEEMVPQRVRVTRSEEEALPPKNRGGRPRKVR